MKIVLENIVKKYGETVVLDNVSFSVEKGEMTALLGSSGCGKTTLLRIIAGLISHDAGRIIVDGKDIGKLPPQKRNMALVFQNYALFPHMNVYENVAYGLKIKNIDKKEIDIQVKEILNKVNLYDYMDRQISQLSGGQQQRVALARALIIKPDLLLFDEPLSNLDEKLRVSMREEIKAIQTETGITSIYVTHDQEEALSIADKIVVMDRGKIQQIGLPSVIYHEPVNTFVANFIGQANIFNVPIIKQFGKEATVSILHKKLTFPYDGQDRSESAVFMLRPEEIIFAPQGTLAQIVNAVNLGNIIRYTVNTESISGIVIDTLNRASAHKYKMGDKAYIDFDSESLHLLEN